MQERISIFLKSKSFDLLKNSLEVIFFISLFISNLYIYIVNQIISFEIVNFPDFIASRSLSFIIQCLLIIFYTLKIFIKEKNLS